MFLINAAIKRLDTIHKDLNRKCQAQFEFDNAKDYVTIAETAAEGNSRQGNTVCIVAHNLNKVVSLSGGTFTFPCLLM